MSNAPVHVVLVDDYPVAREALPGLLAESGILVAATAATTSEAEEAFDRHNPAVALIGVTAAEHGERGLRLLGGRRGAEGFLAELDPTLDAPALRRALEERAGVEA